MSPQYPDIKVVLTGRNVSLQKVPIIIFRVLPKEAKKEFLKEAFASIRDHRDYDHLLQVCKGWVVIE